jgi:undecaprenyl-diphosphatase
MIFLRSLDLFFTNEFNQIIPHNRFFDYFFSFFSLQGDSIFIWILIILFLVIFEEWKNHWFVVFFIIAFSTSAIFINYGLKNIVQRPRPSSFIQRNLVTNDVCPRDFSFPSGHASTAFAAAAILSGFDKKRKYPYYFLALLIALSRVYLGCHFFLDIISGAIIGYLIGKFYYQLHRFLFHH